MLWANMHLLFWLSLVPFVTAWMGENDFASIPVAIYGAAMIMPAIAYFILIRALIAVPDQPATLAEVIGNDLKGKISIVGYVAAVPIALFLPLVSVLLYVLVASIWIVPDRRMERAVNSAPR